MLTFGGLLQYLSSIEMRENSSSKRLQMDRPRKKPAVPPIADISSERRVSPKIMNYEHIYLESKQEKFKLKGSWSSLVKLKCLIKESHASEPLYA